QRLATGDADFPQRQQAEDARNIGAGPAAGIPPAARGVIAEIGRKQHGALEQFLDRRARHAERKAAAGGMADQRQRGGRDTLAHDSDKIGKVVLKLTDITDIAARARGAVAANVDGIAFDPALRQRPGECVDGVSAGAGRAMNDDGYPSGRWAADGVMAEAEMR